MCASRKDRGEEECTWAARPYMYIRSWRDIFIERTSERKSVNVYERRQSNSAPEFEPADTYRYRRGPRSYVVVLLPPLSASGCSRAARRLQLYGRACAHLCVLIFICHVSGAGPDSSSSSRSPPPEIISHGAVKIISRRRGPAGAGPPFDPRGAALGRGILPAFY